MIIKSGLYSYSYSLQIQQFALRMSKIRDPCAANQIASFCAANQIASLSKWTLGYAKRI